ncbi:TetR/AcrR family transcriptional regulator [Cognatiyoonia sp. IB215182]|uniref:TetR/AcrR family transcriptional regulator n=1 Tax=Cognatiyoonia sp. IB215182 TaxID=3097353 RepID=UPI002A17F055|nr:TetR/AcrR family transcriptional regulator [Cognatiyoonia sp. IB215182]MDX8354057.1 TetR/AcrR family transcriptional regulator [Cognatiyoonia sp. IB215182]
MSSQIRDQTKPERGRPRGFEEKTVLDGLTDTFWRKGFADASLDDLSQATGAARASLYKFYGDKADLLVVALDHYAERFDLRVQAAIAENETAREALHQVLRASAERLTDTAAPPGCLRCRTTLEMSQVDPRIDAAIARANHAFTLNMARLLAMDADLAEPPRPLAQHAAFLTAIVNGMVVSAAAGTDRATLYAIVDTTIGAITTA